MALPSGRLIRGISLRGPDRPGPGPEFALYLLREQPQGVPVPWEYRWVYVRRQYDPHAVETDEQRRYVAAFG